MVYVKGKLVAADDSKFDSLMLKKYHNPTYILLFSIFLGAFGVDRFMIGDTGIGIAKCGIWPLIDIFVSYRRAKEKNFESVMLEL